MKSLVKKLLIIILVVSVVASIKVTPKNIKTVMTSKFLGLNTANELQLKAGESADMCNFRITADYRLKKREGLSKFKIDYSVLTETELNNTIWGSLWYGKLGNDTKSYIYRFIGVENPASGSINNFIIKIDLEEQKSVLRSYISIDLSETQYMFYKNNTLYILTGEGYYKFDGTTSVSVDGTVPTLYVNVKPNLSDRADKVFQPINALNGWRKVNYYADNTAVYTIPEAPYPGSIPDIKVNGILKESDTHYTRSGNIVTFTTGNIPSAGSNVEITYYVHNIMIRPKLNKCRHGIFFGGNQDADLFIWGNPDDKNKIYYTYGGDVEFFPATNYLNIGTSESGVTGAAIQNNTLALFTDQGIYSLKTSINTNSESLVTTVTYPLTYVKDDRGHAYPNCDVKVINNNPFFISKDNSIWELTVSTFRDDRAAKLISERVQEALKGMNLSNAITIDWEAKGEYWLVAEQKAIIFNYRNNTWYKFDFTFDVLGYILVDDRLMLYDYKDYFIFDENNTNDFGYNIIYAYWESPYLSFGADHLFKSIQSMFMTVAAISDKDTFVRVEYWTNDNPNIESNEFTLLQGEPPKQLFAELSANDFSYIKFKFVSDKLEDTAVLLNYTVKVQYGGDVN